MRRDSRPEMQREMESKSSRVDSGSGIGELNCLANREWIRAEGRHCLDDEINRHQI